MTTRSSILAPLLLLAVLGCGEEDLGVLSVRIALHPVPVPAPPADIGEKILASAALSSGEATADVLYAFGSVKVAGLSALPAGFSYVASLQFASSPRAALPGAGDSGGALRTVEVGALLEEEPGVWRLLFNSTNLAGAALGALRAGMVQIRPPAGGGEPVVILQGEAKAAEGAETTQPSGGGHVHGA